ncbi:hypothetical protein [Roseibium litorale]|uniref:Voltage-gated sodium channel n=1 Tax=Roseibium litorale TaxID=2803841 RepID=A0ABR9CQK6_9HYPH|nr:hypothetical protein [Roseibium litorale]MBD8893146.1 hypothetical protein [Roseibium litorale]
MGKWKTFQLILDWLRTVLAAGVVITLTLSLSDWLAVEMLAILQRIMLLLVILYGLVAAARLLVQGLVFFRDIWNLFDLALLVLALMLGMPGILALLLLRMFQNFRLSAELSALFWLSTAVLKIARQLARCLGATVVLIFCAALTMTAVLRSVYPDHFGTLWISLETLLLHGLDPLPRTGLAVWLVWFVWGLAGLLWLGHVLRMLMPDFWQAVEIEEELALVEEASAGMKLMQLETRLLSEEFAVEAEAERILIRAETDRVLREVNGLRRQMEQFTRRYS